MQHDLLPTPKLATIVFEALLITRLQADQPLYP